MTKPGSGWEMKDFRWRPTQRRPRRRSLLALPEWLTTALAVVVVLISCGLAAALARPYAEQFVAAASTPTLEATTAVALASATAPFAAGSPGATRTPRPSPTRLRAASATPEPVVVEPTPLGPTPPAPTAEPTGVEPTAAVENTPAADPGLQIGATVIVFGTSGIGVSVRREPGISGALIRVAPDGTRLTIVGGPVEADGYVWWQVHEEGHDDGWSAQNFLQPESP